MAVKNSNSLQKQPKPNTIYSAITKKQKRKLGRFLEVYSTTHNILKSCQASKLGLTTYYEYYNQYPDFQKMIQEAETEVFDEAYNTIKKASKRGNVNASKFILQERDLRFAKDKQPADNRKIIINYPHWS